MQKDVRAPSAGKDLKTASRKPKSNEFWAGIAVIVWALVAAVATEI